MPAVPGHARCVQCGEFLGSWADVERHAFDRGHTRIDIVLPETVHEADGATGRTIGANPIGTSPEAVVHSGDRTPSTSMSHAGERPVPADPNVALQKIGTAMHLGDLYAMYPEEALASIVDRNRIERFFADLDGVDAKAVLGQVLIEAGEGYDFPSIEHLEELAWSLLADLGREGIQGAREQLEKRTA